MAREIQEKTAFRQECTFGRKTLYSPSIPHSVRNATIAESRIPNGMRGIERAVCFYRTIMPTALFFNSKGREAILRTTFTTGNGCYGKGMSQFRTACFIRHDVCGWSGKRLVPTEQSEFHSADFPIVQPL